MHCTAPHLTCLTGPDVGGEPVAGPSRPPPPKKARLEPPLRFPYPEELGEEAEDQITPFSNLLSMD